MSLQLPPRGVRFTFYGGPHDGRVELARAGDPTSWGILQWSASDGGRAGYRFAVVSPLLAELLASAQERFEETGELDFAPLDAASAHCFEMMFQRIEADGVLNVVCQYVGAVLLDSIVGKGPTTRLSPA